MIVHQGPMHPVPLFVPETIVADTRHTAGSGYTPGPGDYLWQDIGFNATPYWDGKWISDTHFVQHSVVPMGRWWYHPQSIWRLWKLVDPTTMELELVDTALGFDKAAGDYYSWGFHPGAEYEPWNWHASALSPSMRQLGDSGLLVAFDTPAYYEVFDTDTPYQQEQYRMVVEVAKVDGDTITVTDVHEIEEAFWVAVNAKYGSPTDFDDLLMSRSHIVLEPRQHGDAWHVVDFMAPGPRRFDNPTFDREWQWLALEINAAGQVVERTCDWITMPQAAMDQWRAAGSGAGEPFSEAGAWVGETDDFVATVHWQTGTAALGFPLAHQLHWFRYDPATRRVSHRGDWQRLEDYTSYARRNCTVITSTDPVTIVRVWLPLQRGVWEITCEQPELGRFDRRAITVVSNWIETAGDGPRVFQQLPDDWWLFAVEHLPVIFRIADDGQLEFPRHRSLQPRWEDTAFIDEDPSGILMVRPSGDIATIWRFLGSTQWHLDHPLDTRSDDLHANQGGVLDMRRIALPAKAVGEVNARSGFFRGRP